MNLAWWLERACDEAPDQLSVVDGRGGERLTYAQLQDRSRRIASVLREQFGVRPGDVVATILPDDCWHTAIFYGVLRLGAIFSGFNRSLGVAKFEMDARRSKVRVLIVAQRYVDHARALLDGKSVTYVAVCDEPFPSDFRNLRVESRTAADGIRIEPRREAEIAAVNFTGGTSGVAKGVIFTHGKLSVSAQASLFYDRLRSKDVNLSCISLYHSGGIHDAVKWVMACATNVLMNGWDATLAARLIEEFRPSWIYFWVPTMIRDLMRLPAWRKLPLRGMKSVLGGEPVPAELQSELDAVGMLVSNAYGMTETMPMGILRSLVSFGDRPPEGSCGKPVPELCEFVLKDPQTGEIVRSADVIAEVCVRGDVVTPGYHNDAERTAASFDAEGFLHTRDLARFDANGWYYISGRTDDIINSGAEKLSLLEVEEVLRQFKGVVDVGCIGVAHERFGEVPAAFVVVDHGIEEHDMAADLDGHCLAKLERWKRPRLYAQVREIPRTLPKRTKNIMALRELVRDIRLSDARQFYTFAAIKSEKT